MATIIKDKEQFIEQDCTIHFNGKSFTSGGSWLARNTKTGKFEGILYANANNKEVTSWDGTLRIPAYYGKVFNGNFINNKKQYVWFTYEGRKFIGINYSVGYNEALNCKEIK